MYEQSQPANIAAANEPLTPLVALAQVRAAVPLGQAQSVAIHCDVWSHGKALLGPKDAPIEVGFRVWDGQSVFAAASLEQAVACCIAAHRPTAPAKKQAQDASAFFAEAGALNRNPQPAEVA